MLEDRVTGDFAILSDGTKGAAFVQVGIWALINNMGPEEHSWNLFRCIYVRMLVAPYSWPRNESYSLFILRIHKLDTFEPHRFFFSIHHHYFWLLFVVCLLVWFDIMAPVAYTPPEPQSPPRVETLTGDYRNSMRTWDIVTQVICLIISTICIALRMYSKVYIVRNPGWEDCEFPWFGFVVWVFPAERVICDI